jgi:hypothetical protein
LFAYDPTGDGQADYAEHLSDAGWIDRLFFDDDGDGAWDEVVERSNAVPTHQLVLILDSVPFEMVAAAHGHGRFALFHSPSRVVSPFPAMTDMSLNELLGTSPSRGLESDFYDGERLISGWRGYPHADNSPWLAHVDWYFPYKLHGRAYLKPERYFLIELARIERALARAADGTLVAYCVGPSALGFSIGREGHLCGLAAVERFCRMLVHRYRGRIAITLLSDHGHDLVASRSVELRRLLVRLGYRVTTRLRDPGDVVAPDFGLISCAGVYTQSPSQVAADLVQADGIEHALYRDGDDVVVLAADGRARIAPCAGGWTYRCEFGDPLALAAIIEQLRGAGAVDDCGCIDDAALFGATVDHVHPDALDRCWRAYHGLIEHTPDVLLSLASGWHWGSPFIDRHMSVTGSHGSLNRAGTIGFVMSTEGELPEVLRMRDLSVELEAIGVNLRHRFEPRPQASGPHHAQSEPRP